MRLRLLAFCAVLLLPGLASAAMVGRVLSSSGDAHWRTGAASTSWEDLNRGDEVIEGASVRTGKNGALRMLMKDRSILSIGPSSELSLARYATGRGKRNVSIKMTVGLLWARVTSLFGNDSTYDIETHTAVAGVRGTDLVVAAQRRGPTDVVCLTGAVWVRSPFKGQGVTLVKHQRASVTSLGAITTDHLTPGQLRRLSRKLRVGKLDSAKRGQRMQGASITLDNGPVIQGQLTTGGQGGGGKLLDNFTPTTDVPPINLEPTGESGRLRGRVEIKQP